MGGSKSSSGGRPVTADDLRMEQELREQMGQLSVPMLQRRQNQHEYLFFAFMDGTGQDLDNPRLGPPTTVGSLYRQAFELSQDADNRMGTHYSKGIGTQANAVGRAFDGMTAHSWADGIEKTYSQLAAKVAEWKERDPEAEVRVAAMGYSRGAVQTPGLLRLIDQYGVADPRGLEFGRDSEGNITVKTELPLLTRPGAVAQAAILLDPVATNMPDSYDARLAPSVISRVSILAFHEQRPLFPHQTINAPGISFDGRAMNVAAPGGHSNVGGGNREPGLEILTANAAIDYLNLLRDEPMFEKRPIPLDLATITVFQAKGATAVWGLSMDHDGIRDLQGELANCKIVDPCRESEPVNLQLAAQFEYRSIQPNLIEQAQLEALVQLAKARDLAQAPVAQPAPQTVAADQQVPALGPDSPGHPSHAAFLRIREGVQTAEAKGQISFASDQEREQFAHAALASMKDNRDTQQKLYPNSTGGSLDRPEMSRIDDFVVGTKGYAFLVQNGSTQEDQRRVPIDIEQAKQTPTAVSDAKLEAASEQTDRQQELQRQQAQSRGPEEQAIGGFAR